jgi:hypothetical protein
MAEDHSKVTFSNPLSLVSAAGFCRKWFFQDVFCTSPMASFIGNATSAIAPKMVPSISLGMRRSSKRQNNAGPGSLECRKP